MNCKKAVSVFVCAILGAGFATGKELMEYFLKFGIWGIFGIFISSVLFGLIAYKAMSSKYTNVNQLLDNNIPTPFNKVFSFLILLFLIVLFSAMISACGELFKSVFNINCLYGSAIITLLTLFSIYSNSKLLADICKSLFPVIILITIITGVYIVANMDVKIFVKPFDAKLIPTAMVYTSYNIITAAAVLLPYNNKNFALKSTILGSTAFFMLAVVLSLPILFNFDAVSNSALPILTLLHKKNIVFYLYIFMLVSAIFTTAFASGFSACQQYNVSPAVVTFVAFLLSFIGFSNIVENMYFVFGVLGGVLMILILKS